MCYNFSHYHEYHCSHHAKVRQQTVDCNRKQCKFSRMHETESHDCELTCAQVMLPDQGIITDAYVVCPRCADRTNGH